MNAEANQAISTLANALSFLVTLLTPIVFIALFKWLSDRCEK